jgi:hypothetical protein
VTLERPETNNTYQKRRFFIKIRLFFAVFLAKSLLAATLFVAATTRQMPYTKAFQVMCGSMAAIFRNLKFSGAIRGTYCTISLAYFRASAT